MEFLVGFDLTIPDEASATEVKERVGTLSEPFADGEGLRFPAQALVAAGSA